MDALSTCDLTYHTLRNTEIDCWLQLRQVDMLDRYNMTRRSLKLWYCMRIKHLAGCRRPLYSDTI